LFDRCQEVQANPDGYLDLWAREHYKSSILTFGKSIQDILNDPEITIGIFSHTKSIARSFLKQIRYEFETNEFLKSLFPDILWENPRTDTIKAGVSWSDEKGITIKRQGNPKENTIESSGIVDGQPTSKHYKLLVYDDICTLESVSTPEQIKKTTEALLLSYNLGAEGGARRFIGTRYHAMDTYQDIMDKKSVIPRIYPAVDKDGVPVLLPQQSLDDKRRDLGPYVFGSQMLQNPLADNAQGFKREWLRLYRTAVDWQHMNRYIIVDPAGEKKKVNDYTSMFVVGLSRDNNYYILDIVRDRLNLTERTNTLFALHQRWDPISEGYERYGMQSDIQHIQYVMDLQGYHFNIFELGGALPKNDRLKRLVPVFEQGRMWFPETMLKTDYQGRVENLTDVFIREEYIPFPVASHDDLLDCLARIVDEGLKCMFPMRNGFVAKPRQKRFI
jgi:phage terminase large subunit-like protein